MKVLRQRLGDAVRFEGVGGQVDGARRAGLAVSDRGAVDHRAGGVVQQLPKILRLIRETAAAVTEAAPDVLVIIDSPDFTHRVARRVRARDPSIPIVDYVSPSVWAWRPGRARAMRAYVDHVLALLPFEPEEYRRLHGPPCSYVGHPLTEQIATLAARSVDEQGAGTLRRRCCWCCREAAAARSGTTWRCSARRSERLQAEGVAFEAVLPTMPHLQEAVAEACARAGRSRRGS